MRTSAPPRPPGAAAAGGADQALTGFQRAVVDVVEGLRPGELATYGEVATQVGSPGAAQAVANVLRRVDGLPWWRVVPSDGRLYRTHAPVQAPLLRAEGVLVGDEGYVDVRPPLLVDAEVHARAVAFERACQRVAADRCSALPWGEVVDAQGAPRIYDQTFVAVDRDAPHDLDADSVLAAVDAHLCDAPSPRLRVEDPRLAERLLPALRARGWEPGWLAVCRWSGEPPTPQGDTRILDVEGLVAWTRVVQPRHAWSSDDAVADAVTILRRIGRGVELRGVAATDAQGTLLGACRLYEGDGVAQIEEVEVLAEHRGAGVGRRIVHAALHAATAAPPGVRPPLVFLLADADDWPLRWYRRLGFVDVGRLCVFSRQGP